MSERPNEARLCRRIQTAGRIGSLLLAIALVGSVYLVATIFWANPAARLPGPLDTAIGPATAILFVAAYVAAACQLDTAGKLFRSGAAGARPARWPAAMKLALALLGLLGFVIAPVVARMR